MAMASWRQSCLPANLRYPPPALSSEGRSEKKASASTARLGEGKGGKSGGPQGKSSYVLSIMTWVDLLVHELEVSHEEGNMGLHVTI